jgi:hypothetical protein
MPWVPIGIGRAPRGLPELNENVARVRFRARALILPTSPRPHPAGLFLAMGISDGTSSLWACGTPRVWATLAVELPWEAPLCLTHLLLVRRSHRTNARLSYDCSQRQTLWRAKRYARCGHAEGGFHP